MTTGLVTEGEVKETTSYKGLVNEKFWKRLVGRIQKDEGIVQKEAEQIMDAALGFLKLCADYPGNKFAPSTKVDIGWHTLLMYTREYEEFCWRVAGRFIHHNPNDENGGETGFGGSGRTAGFMEMNDIPHDKKMWETTAGPGDCRDDCWNCTTDR